MRLIDEINQSLQAAAKAKALVPVDATKHAHKSGGRRSGGQYTEQGAPEKVKVTITKPLSDKDIVRLSTRELTINNKYLNNAVVGDYIEYLGIPLLIIKVGVMNSTLRLLKASDYA